MMILIFHERIQNQKSEIQNRLTAWEAKHLTLENTILPQRAQRAQREARRGNQGLFNPGHVSKMRCILLFGINIFYPSSDDLVLEYLSCRKNRKRIFSYATGFGKIWSSKSDHGNIKIGYNGKTRNKVMAEACYCKALWCAEAHPTIRRVYLMG
jgi:hypothetical protein